ncbi:MAG: L-threonylcarbamoyladenylate synthase [Parachlamydiaceae bacterium]
MRISLPEAVLLLESGKVIAVPTETVYGLAARLDRPEAITNIFSLKGRPSNNPLIIHVASPEEIPHYVDSIPDDFYKLSKTFWPGPLTLILPAKTHTIPDIARAGLPTAAFRVPDHLLTRELLSKTGPLVMPSANLSGSPSATSREHVETDFGIDFPVLDGGACHKGLESTILYLNQEKIWIVARLGALVPEDFAPILGYIPEVMKKGGETPICPGQLYRHYAPKSRLFLMTTIPADSEGAIIGYSDRQYPQGCRLFSLGNSLNPAEAAQRLYAVLRQLDIERVESAIVDMNIPNDGLWLTLKERLLKAAEKKIL